MKYYRLVVLGDGPRPNLCYAHKRPAKRAAKRLRASSKQCQIRILTIKKKEDATHENHSYECE